MVFHASKAHAMEAHAMEYPSAPAKVSPGVVTYLGVCGVRHLCNKVIRLESTLFFPGVAWPHIGKKITRSLANSVSHLISIQTMSAVVKVRQHSARLQRGRLTIGILAPSVA